MKRIALLLAGCMAIASTPALAAPFFVTLTDTLNSSSTAPYNVGENVVIVVRFDNGGNTTESQTWDSSDILTIRYLFNDDPNTITTTASKDVANPTCASVSLKPSRCSSNPTSSWTGGNPNTASSPDSKAR